MSQAALTAAIAPRHKRIAIVLGAIVAAAAAAALALNAFRSNLMFFYSPSQVTAKEAPAGRAFRLGGLVERGSVKRDEKPFRGRRGVADEREVKTGVIVSARKLRQIIRGQSAFNNMQ